MAGYCFKHAYLLRRQPYAQRFLKLFLDTGKKGFADAGIRATVIGTVIIAYMIKNLSTNSEIAIKILVLFVVREIGPLLAALIVLVRIGTVFCANLSVMKMNGELRSLRLLGVSPRDYLAVPAVFAIALANVVLTFYFQLVGIGGGIVLSALLLDLSIREMLEHLMVMMTPVDVAYTAIKSFFFGLIIASVSAHFGLQSERTTVDGLPDALSRSVMQSLFLILLFNALFAYIVYGILFFGMIHGAR